MHSFVPGNKDIYIRHMRSFFDFLFLWSFVRLHSRFIFICQLHFGSRQSQIVFLRQTKNKTFKSINMKIASYFGIMSLNTAGYLIGSIQFVFSLVTLALVFSLGNGYEAYSTVLMFINDCGLWVILLHVPSSFMMLVGLYNRRSCLLKPWLAVDGAKLLVILMYLIYLYEPVFLGQFKQSYALHFLMIGLVVFCFGELKRKGTATGIFMAFLF